MSDEKAAGSGLREFRRRAEGVARAGERRSTSAAKEMVEPGHKGAQTGMMLQNALCVAPSPLSPVTRPWARGR